MIQVFAALVPSKVVELNKNPVIPGGSHHDTCVRKAFNSCVGTHVIRERVDIRVQVEVQERYA